MVYHRLSHEESIQNGRTVRRRSGSPNGIIPTLLSFFSTATWRVVAWSIHDPKSAIPFETHTSVDRDRYPNSLPRVALTKDDVDASYKRFSKEASGRRCTLSGSARSSKRTTERSSRSTGASRGAAAEAAEGEPCGCTTTICGWSRRCALRPDVKIAFFHHTYFPSADTFNVLGRGDARSSAACCNATTSFPHSSPPRTVDVVRGVAPLTVPSAATARRASDLRLGRARRDDHGDGARPPHRPRAHPVGLDVDRIRTILADPRTVERTTRCAANSKACA